MLFKKQNVRTVALIFSTLTYLLVGAAVFVALESNFEETEGIKLLNEELAFRQRYNVTAVDFELITRNVLRSAPHKAGIQWKFAGSVYFSTTVITTIGYGHSTPQTPGGKVFCMFYALAGIPLNLVMFQSIGERLNVITTFLLTRIVRVVRRCLCEQRRSADETLVSSTHLIVVSLSFSSLVVAGGAWAFSRCEGWTYLDSIYYCIVTLTTVGFGDLVALQSDGVLQSSPAYVVFSIFFILVGLAVVSAAMNLLVLRFLTMNTEDERRDELRMLIAAASARRISGELGDLVVDGRRSSTTSDLGSSARYVISRVNGSASGTKPTAGQRHSRQGNPASSVWRRSRPRYHVIRPPSVITHLLPTPPSPHSALRTPTSTAWTGCDVTVDAGKPKTLRDLADQGLRPKRGSI